MSALDWSFYTNNAILLAAVIWVLVLAVRGAKSPQQKEAPKEPPSEEPFVDHSNDRSDHDKRLGLYVEQRTVSAILREK